MASATITESILHVTKVLKNRKTKLIFPQLQITSLSLLLIFNVSLLAKPNYNRVCTVDPKIHSPEILTSKMFCLYPLSISFGSSWANIMGTYNNYSLP